jgi:hypothetical protein
MRKPIKFGPIPEYTRLDQVNNATYLALSFCPKGKTMSDSKSHLFSNTCRVVPVLKHEKEDTVTSYDKESIVIYCLMLLKQVLGYFGFNANVYRKSENRRNTINRKKWWDESKEERRNDIEAERASSWGLALNH